MVLESLLGVAVAAADFRVGRGQVSSTHSGVSRRHTLPRRAVPGERARPRRHVIVAFGGSSPSAVCLLLTVSRAPGLVRLCRVAALYICAGARLRRGVSGARLSSDASPARGGARLLPPLGRTKGTVADQRTVVTGRPGGWRSTRAPATEGARSAASHRRQIYRSPESRKPQIHRRLRSWLRSNNPRLPEVHVRPQGFCPWRPQKLRMRKRMERAKG
jgi:hypothetical protein